MKKLLSELKDWVRREQTHTIVYQQNVQAIETELASPNSKSPAYVASAASLLSEWECAQGMVSVLEGKGGGWQRILNGLCYKYWFLRTILRLYDEDTRRAKSARVGFNEGASCLALAMALGEAEVTGWLGPRFIKGFEDGAFGSSEDLTFEPFLAKLYSMAASTVFDERRFGIQSFGVYDWILGAWQAGGEPLSEALVAACEYHLERTEDVGDEVIVEFTSYPITILPAEIIAIRNVRSALGLQTPSIAHPLVDTPLSSPPSSIPRMDDPLLKRAVSFIRERVPDV